MKTCASLSQICCSHPFPLNTPDDIRTEDLKKSGCCPAALLPPQPGPPGPEPCNLNITNFNGTNTTIDPRSGGNISFSGSINSDQSVNWTITVAGKTFNGTGTSPSATWNGKEASDKVVEPGTYTATLTATTADGKCSDTKSINFSITASDNDCKLSVEFGSSANLASGNLYHSQTLFTVNSSKLMPNLTISYNSSDGYSGVLGTGWTHNYNITLRANTDDDTYTLMKGDGGRTVLYKNGIYYTPLYTSYPALTKNADGTYSLYYKSGINYTFNTQGKITSIMDRNGNAANLTYNANNNLTVVTDPAGKTINFIYNSANRISSITDSNNNTHTFTYSGETLVQVSSQSSLGTQVWTYTYDDKAFLLTKTDPLGYKTQYSYGANHRVIQSTDPEGMIRSIQYDTPSSTTTVIEKNGGIWTYKYNTTLGVLMQKTDPQGNTTRYDYDGNRNLIQKTDPDG
ncbi:MAG: DUF6531 domain-containing protein, partial [Bacteroidota bacterium]|nr:DUF6531 domain-containing protein [Bacteroidota bacterium]